MATRNDHLLDIISRNIIFDCSKSVWEQDYTIVQRKIAECIELHDRYIENYQNERNRLEEAAKELVELSTLSAWY